MSSDRDTPRSSILWNRAALAGLAGTLVLSSMLTGCGGEDIDPGAVGVGGGEGGRSGRIQDDSCDDHTRIWGVEVAKNEQGVFVLLQHGDKPSLGSPSHTLLYLYDDGEFTLLSRAVQPLLDLTLSKPGLWSLSASEVLVSGQTTSCALELLDVTARARKCVLGLSQSPSYVRVVSEDFAILAPDGESLFEYDGLHAHESHRLDALDSSAGLNSVNALWADEEAIYVAASGGVYVAERSQPLKRIMEGRSALGGIYAQSPDSVWVMQDHDGRKTIEHFDGEKWSTAWPPAEPFGDSRPRDLGWSNEMWGSGEEMYFISYGVLYRFSPGALEAIVGEEDGERRNVLDMWGVASDEIYVVSTPRDPSSGEASAGSCPYVELHRFDGTTLSTL